MKRIFVLVCALCLISALAYADGIHGQCYASSGEKCMESNHTISTSWNGNKAYPDSQGRYSLNLGGSVDKTITVYCDGNSVGSVHVSGDEEFNVHCK
ncbi:MAG: hypothetical protein P9M14_13300 [Candidatus Alcyoniella australis]|nr:hypothetical protein [Candidatus Alcyoniella australis]